MRRAIGLILVALAFPACDAEEPGEGVVDDAFAQAIGNCADLEAHIKTQATREMNAEIDRIIDSLDNTSPDILFSGPSPRNAAAAPNPTADTRESATEFTTTNVQEAGVDEPDFVKNDGSRIFVLHDRTLIVMAAWPAESSRIESTTALEGYPLEMILYKNTLVVFSNTSLDLPGGGGGTRSLELRAFNDSVKVTVLDVSSPAPRIVQEQYLEGQYVSARRADAAVRLVSTATGRGPELRYWPDGDVNWENRGAAVAALQKLRAENAKRIKAAALTEWLPRLLEPTSGQGRREIQRDCASFFATNVPARLGFTTVTTVDLNALATTHSTILNAADEVYASRDALYLTARHHWFSRPSETRVREDHTYVFKFDTRSDASRVRYVASGSVPGHIVNPFALDEEGGFLRIATTRQTWLGWRLQASTNNVFVLRAAGGRLERTGEVTGLARDERIFSARFEGERGFLVTFRNIDPLFTLDLSNPAQPRVAGELKVPGFSTYLHLMDRDHLLTVGRDTTGAQLQVFDVSNFASPALQHRYVLGTSSSSSEAEYDHKAFTYFASRGLLALPFSDWSATRTRQFTSSLQVLRATVAEGIQPVGSIEHADLVETSNRGYYGWTPQIRRSVMMESYVYSISYGGTKVHDVRDLSRPLVTMPFPN